MIFLVKMLSSKNYLKHDATLGIFIMPTKPNDFSYHALRHALKWLFGQCSSCGTTHMPKFQVEESCSVHTFTINIFKDIEVWCIETAHEYLYVWDLKYHVNVQKRGKSWHMKGLLIMFANGTILTNTHIRNNIEICTISLWWISSTRQTFP